MGLGSSTNDSPDLGTRLCVPSCHLPVLAGLQDGGSSARRAFHCLRDPNLRALGAWVFSWV